MSMKFDVSGKAQATAASTNVISFRSTSAVRLQLVEFGVFSEAATALNLALFMTTVVDTAGTGVTAVKQDPASAAAACSCVTGPTGGTLAATAQRRAYLPAVAGSAAIFTWPDNAPLIVPLSLSLVVRNDVASAGPAITWYATWQE